MKHRQLYPVLCSAILLAAPLIGYGQGQRPAAPPRGGPGAARESVPPREEANAARDEKVEKPAPEQVRREAERADRAERPAAAARGRETVEAAREAASQHGFTARDRERIAGIPSGQYPPGIQRRIEAGKGLPPGLERREEEGKGLPQGWTQRLRTGERIEPAVEAAATPVPRTLRRRLPTTPRGYEDLMVEDRLIRVDRRSRAVIDTVELGPEAAPPEVKGEPSPERPAAPEESRPGGRWRFWR